MTARSILPLLLPWLLAAAPSLFGGEDPLERRSTESKLSEAQIQDAIRALGMSYPGYSGMGPVARRAFAVLYQRTLTSKGDAALVHHALQARTSSKDARPPGFQPLSPAERLRFVRLLESDGSASFSQPLSLSLFDEDATVRAAAARALGAHTDPKLPQAFDVLGALELARSRETDAQVQRAIDAAMGAGPMESRLSEATIQETIKALVKEHPGLAGMGPKAQRAFAVMHQQTKGSQDDAALVRHVLQARTSSRDARPPGFQPLSLAERLRFVRLLDSDGSASYAQPLSLSLFDEDASVRGAAAKALGAHTDPKLPQAFDVLGALDLARSREPDPEVKKIIETVMHGLPELAQDSKPQGNPPAPARGVLGHLRDLGGSAKARQK